MFCAGTPLRGSGNLSSAGLSVCSRRSVLIPRGRDRWIPALAGPFLAGLRMYGLSATVQNDQWHMPALEKAD